MFQVEAGEADQRPEQILPIVFATDDNYAPYAGVAIRSIISHADPRNTYRIFILYTSLSEEYIEALEGLSAENVTVRCRYIEPSMSGVRSPLPELRYISMVTYYRILIPEIEEFKACPHVVYLDCDLIVNTDIAGIVPQSMGDNLIAGVRDHNLTGAKDRERLQRDFRLEAEQYVNAGVLVLNVPQWIRENTARKCFDYMSSTPADKLLYMDQDVLNAVCKDRILYLDAAWNYNWSWVYGDKKTVECCKPITERIGEDFHILHFASPFKPWNTLEHPYSHYFWKYAAQTPFLEEIIKKNLCSRKELEQNAVSLRIGRAITWVPRKVLGGIQCYRDNGAGYTFRRVLYHVGLWRDEEEE